VTVASSAEVLVEGAAGSGSALLLSAPISFWGGVDASSGVITDVRHPQFGDSIAGRVLFVPETSGSSSSSAVLLELVRAGKAPGALVLHQPDAILLLGLIVAREMGWPSPPALRMDRRDFARFRGRSVAVDGSGLLSIVG
jgi:predicted aconitase with swiveling domain